MNSAAGKLRLSGGAYGGRWIAVPRGARPTEGRVREALFSAWQDRLPGAWLLDLFAGSGAIALEALGRGAVGAVAVDRDRRAAEGIARSARELGVPEGALRVLHRPLPGGLTALEKIAVPGPSGVRTAGSGPFPLIFADPPYAFSDYGELLTAVAPWLGSDGEMALEHPRRRGEAWATPGLPLALHRQRHYGESTLSFFRPVPAEDPDV